MCTCVHIYTYTLPLLHTQHSSKGFEKIGFNVHELRRAEEGKGEGGGGGGEKGIGKEEAEPAEVEGEGKDGRGRSVLLPDWERCEAVVTNGRYPNQKLLQILHRLTYDGEWT